MDDFAQHVGLRIGDALTVPARDRRNWWQRLLPRWLGGTAAPRPDQRDLFVVTAVSD